MLRWIEAELPKCVHHEGLVREGLERRAGLGNQDEEGMRDVNVTENSGCVIRIDITDELCIHLEETLRLRPVLECEIHRARTQVTSADTDLNDRGKLLAGCIGDLTGMNLLREFGDALLLLYVECALVLTVCDHILTELSAGQLVKHETLLTGVDHITVVEILILLCKLCFRSQLHERCEDILIDGLRTVVVCHALCHRHGIVLYTSGTILAGHDFLQVHCLHLLQLCIG